MGIYQLVFPVYALGFSLTCAGIQTILSRLTAKNTSSWQRKRSPGAFVLRPSDHGLFILYCYTPSAKICKLCSRKLSEGSPLRRSADPSVLCLSLCRRPQLYLRLLFRAQGNRDPCRIPAAGTVRPHRRRPFDLSHRKSQGVSFQISLAVIGLILGELASSSFCLYMLRKQETPEDAYAFLPGACPPCAKTSGPFSSSDRQQGSFKSSAKYRSCLHPLEAAALWNDRPEALSVYGVLTGMALPCILFPSALTNSVSTMLLPEVADLQAVKDRSGFLSLVRKTACSCIAMGSICCVFLFVTGPWIGRWLFHSSLAGTLIRTLAFMCPFLYTNGTLISMINGTGKTSVTFLINGASLSLRLFSVFLLIPLSGSWVICGECWQARSWCFFPA